MYDIGRSKRAQRAYALDDIAIVPQRRTRGIEEVDLTWRIDALTLDFPLIAAPMDSIMSPATAIEVGRMGGLGVLNLEGIWTRYDDPQPLLEELAGIEDADAATRRLQEVYSAPIQAGLIRERMAQIRDAGVPVAGSLSPQNTALAAKQPTSTFRTKSSGERAQKSAKGASWYSVMPSSATRRCFSRSGKMRPPLRGWSAGSEKVNAAAVSPWAAA